MAIINSVMPTHEEPELRLTDWIKTEFSHAVQYPLTWNVSSKDLQYPSGGDRLG